MSTRNHADEIETLLAIGGIILLVLCGAAYLKVQALANMLGTDVDTSFSLIKRFGLLAVGVLVLAWRKLLADTFTYLPAAVMVCMIPLLDWWAWDYRLVEAGGKGLLQIITPDTWTPQNAEAAWYGTQMWQAVLVMGLIILGGIAQWKIAERQRW